MTDRLPAGSVYQPSGEPPAIGPAEFTFAAAFLDHGHINGQTAGLLAAGATLAYVYDPDPARVAAFKQRFGDVAEARSFDEILDDPAVRLVAAAAIPSERCGIGLRAMSAGKDYFTDKSPFTSLEQLERARRKVEETGRKYAVYYAERLHNRPTYEAGELVRNGAIGRVLQIIIMAPHNLRPERRPAWFFEKDRYGGVITDIGSHQFEQFLYFSGAQGGSINFARVENFAHPQWPGLEDFGEVSLTLDTGASAYCRIDWFNPPGSRTWGDGRAFVLGTDGYVEVRKNVDVANEASRPGVILVNDEERRIALPDGPFPFFGRLIRDCLDRTETAMTQEHAFMAAELSMRAQEHADRARAARNPSS